VAGWPRSWGRSPARALDGMSSRHRRAAAVRRFPALCSAKESTAGVHLADLRLSSRGSEPRTLGTRADRKALLPGRAISLLDSHGNYPRSLGPLGPCRGLTSAPAPEWRTRPTARESQPRLVRAEAAEAVTTVVGHRWPSPLIDPSRGYCCRAYLAPCTPARSASTFGRPAGSGAPAPKMRGPGFGSSALCVFVPRLRGQ
jgi:hypothetical protein